MGAANSLRWHFGRPPHVPIFHGSDNKFPPYLLTHKKMCNKVAINSISFVHCRKWTTIRLRSHRTLLAHQRTPLSHIGKIILSLLPRSVGRAPVFFLLFAYAVGGFSVGTRVCVAFCPTQNVKIAERYSLDTSTAIFIKRIDFFLHCPSHLRI